MREKRTPEQLIDVTNRARHRLDAALEESRYRQRLTAVARRFRVHPVDIEAIMRALGDDAARFLNLH